MGETMKNILIVIHALGCGGAEKSLISLMERLPYDEWNIDLIVASPNGLYMDKIPHRVNQITELYDLENYSTELKQRRKKVCGFKDLGCQIKWQIQSRVNGHKYPHYGENKWAIWGKNLPSLEKHYDLAISYMNGFPNYYVIDKVNADKKVLWIHNEFEKMGYDYDFEAAYYKKADKIVTISQACVDSFARVYPELRNKVVVLEF